jgi:predicted MFS family arabinose efflux permease
VKRTFLFVVASGTALIATTYGLVRLAYGLLLPEAQAELGLGDGSAGLVAAVASVLYCLGALIGFVTADRHPRALVLAAGTSAALGCAAMALAPGATVFAAGAVLSSAGAGLASPALVVLVDRSAPRARVDGTRGIERAARDRAQTAVNAGTGPGLVIAGALALLLLPHWRAAWLLAAAVAALTTALTLSATARQDARPDHRSGHGSRVTAAWLHAHRAPVVAALTLGAGSAAVWSYGRSLLVAAGGAGSASAVAWIALGLGGVAVLPTGGWLVRRRPGTAWALTAGTVAAATLALPIAAPTLPAAVLVCGLAGWGYTAATGALITWTTRIEARRAAAGTAGLFIALVLGQALGAALTGALLPATGALGAFAVSGLIGASGLAVARDPSSRSQRPHRTYGANPDQGDG